MIYGMAANAYRDKLFVDHKIDRPLHDCREDIKKFYNTYSGINPWKNRVWDEGRRFGFLRSRFGRRRHLNFRIDDQTERSYAERQGVNFLIQGDVADIVKAAMIQLDESVESFGAIMIGQVHDSLVFEVEEDRVDECAAHVKSTMENCIKLSVPVLAEVKTGASWGEGIDWQPSNQNSN